MGAKKVLLTCTLLAELSYPLSSEFAPGSWKNVEVKIVLHQCHNQIRLTEWYEAAGKTLGSSRVTFYPLDHKPVEPAPPAAAPLGVSPHHP